KEALGDSVGVNMMVTGSALVTARSDTTPHATQVTGALLPDQMMADSLLLAGRFFTAAEASTGAPVATINHRLAGDYARGRKLADLVGDTLLFQGQPRVVIGVLSANETDRARRA